MQVTGAGMIGGATSKRKDPTIANNVLLAGLAIQTAAFAIFLVLLTIVVFAICGNKHLIEKMRKQKTPYILGCLSYFECAGICADDFPGWWRRAREFLGI